PSTAHASAASTSPAWSRAISTGSSSCVRTMPSASGGWRFEPGLMPTLFEAARACLDAAAVDDKIALTRAHAAAFARGELGIPSGAPPPGPIRMPGRPARPRLVHPRELPRRGLGSPAGRAAFIHAIAHIELNAVDLAWDAVYRF